VCGSARTKSPSSFSLPEVKTRVKKLGSSCFIWVNSHTLSLENGRKHQVTRVSAISPENPQVD
jgi:hypothetical protein